MNEQTMPQKHPALKTMENNPLTQMEIQKEQEIPLRGYFMTYRSGMSPFNFKGFQHRGDLRSARDRAFAHGKIMGYKNIWVIPQFSDLDAEEKKQTYSGEAQINIPENLQPTKAE